MMRVGAFIVVASECASAPESKANGTIPNGIIPDGSVDYMRDDDYVATAVGSLVPALKPDVDKTNLGCACKSVCGATLSEEYGRCDWCYTEKDAQGYDCGYTQSSLFGKSWDYCKYTPMKDFEAQHYLDKTSQLWSRITDRDVVDQSGPSHYAVTTLKDIISFSMITPFDDHREVLPVARHKVIHEQGAVCQFDLEVNSNSPFTGVLSPGTQSGLIRLGSAVSLDEPVAGEKLNLGQPGFGIKFLRSGVQSANWVSLAPNFADSGTFDFFANTFSNHASPADALVKLNKFQQASGCITMVGLSDACSFTQKGEKIDTPVFPFELLFEPTGALSFGDSRKSNDQLLEELAGIPEATDVFKVLAYAEPLDRASGYDPITLGTLRTKGTCHRSLFGDLELFFRHQRMEEDIALRPDWISQMGKLGDSNCQATVGPVGEWQCPRPDLSGMTV